MSLLRFLSAGRFDAEAVSGRLRAAANQPDDALWRVVSDSVFGRVSRGPFSLVGRAAATSVALTRIRAIAQAWQVLPPLDRMRFIGLAVVTAVTVHLLMTWTQSGLDAWRLMLPGLAAIFGIAVWVLSFLGPRAKGSAD